MNAILDVLKLRTVGIFYTSPAICPPLISGSGSSIFLEAVDQAAAPTGLRFEGRCDRFLTWDEYPGLVCMSVYKALDPGDLMGPYSSYVECASPNAATVRSPGWWSVTVLDANGNESGPTTPILADGGSPVPIPIPNDPSNPPVSFTLFLNQDLETPTGLAFPVLTTDRSMAVEIIDESGCFRVQAITADGLSGLSSPVCFDSTGCSLIEFNDMPLNHAIYSASTNKIYGCRGGYLFEFTDTGFYTGRRCAFGGLSLMDSYLAWDFDNNNLWASAWSDYSISEGRLSGKGYYRFDLSTFTVDKVLIWPNLGTAFTTWQTGNAGPLVGDDEWWPTGPRRFSIVNGYIVGNFDDTDGEYGFVKISVADQSDLAYVDSAYNADTGGTGWNCWAYDRIHSDAWAGSDVGFIHWVGDTPPNPTVAPFGNQNASSEYLNCFNWPAGAVYAVAYCPATNLIYGVCCNSTIAIAARTGFSTWPLGNFTPAFFDLGRPTAQPRNIRWVAPNSRFYIPTGPDNAVIEYDPVNAVVTNVFTGFDQPYDIVSTPEGVFAVQLGIAPLKKVTAVVAGAPFIAEG